MITVFYKNSKILVVDKNTNYLTVVNRHKMIFIDDAFSEKVALASRNEMNPGVVATSPCRPVSLTFFPFLFLVSYWILDIGYLVMPACFGQGYYCPVKDDLHAF